MTDAHGSAHDEGHEHHHVNYTLIFGFLCVCTVLSIIFDLSKEHMSWPVLAVLILGVAVSKATFVLLYFMHIKFERAWKYVLLAPTAVLACALPFALAPDISFHYYVVAAPQLELNAMEHAPHGADADHHHDAKPAAGGHEQHAPEAHPTKASEPKHK